MLRPDGVKEDIVCSHLDRGLLLLLFLCLRNQVRDYHLSLVLHRLPRGYHSILLQAIIKQTSVHFSRVFTHLGAGWSSCWAPVRKIAELNVRIKNAHARNYIERR